MHAGFVLNALEQALCERRPLRGGLVHHSDRGVQYVSIKYTERLKDAGVEPSVGSVGDSYDNALAETINGLYKAEVIWRRGPWRNFEAVEFATLEWVDWFNNKRLLEPIGNIPPAEAKRAIMLRRRVTPWRRNSTEMASGKPGAVQVPSRQGCGKLLHALRHPDQGPHGIAQRRGLDQALERGDEPRIVLAKRATTATGTANLPLRQRLCIEITLAAIDRRTGEPGDFRDNRETASTSSPHLGRRKQSPPPLIKLRANRVPPQPNRPRRSCDRLTPVRQNRNPQHLVNPTHDRRMTI